MPRRTRASPQEGCREESFTPLPPAFVRYAERHIEIAEKRKATLARRRMPTLPKLNLPQIDDER